MIRCLVFAASLVALWPATAMAEDFWSLAMGQHYTTWDFIDASSIRARGDGWAKAWVTAVVTGPARTKYPFRRELKEELFNCGSQQIGVLQDITYDAGGSVLSSQPSPVESPSDVVPGSWGDEELHFVCGTD